MFSKLLVPVDGSENSILALEAAIFLSKKIDAYVTVMHVMEKPPTLYIHPQKELEELLQNYRREAEQILEKCEKIGNRNGVELKRVIIEGDVAPRIIKFAEKEAYDMIVMGHRGSGRFKEMVLGSVSEKVLHRAKRSVLIIR
jgi:nucleotide-binding universal stress UspA family protein